MLCTKNTLWAKLWKGWNLFKVEDAQTKPLVDIYHAHIRATRWSWAVRVPLDDESASLSKNYYYE